jgi:hypothetical protein
LERCTANTDRRRIAADRAVVDERGAEACAPAPGGRDRAASRRANPPGAGARADVAVGEVGEAGVIGDYFS